MEKTKSKVRRITYTIITIILVILNIYTLILNSYKSEERIPNSIIICKLNLLFVMRTQN